METQNFSQKFSIFETKNQNQNQATNSKTFN